MDTRRVLQSGPCHSIICDCNPAYWALCAITFTSVLLSQFIKLRNQYYVDMNESSFVLRFTTLTATKTDLSEYNKLELPSVSIAQNWQLLVHGPVANPS